MLLLKHLVNVTKKINLFCNLLWIKNLVFLSNELRPYITSTKNARKFEGYITDDEFNYFYNWILRKELKAKRIAKEKYSK